MLTGNACATSGAPADAQETNDVTLCAVRHWDADAWARHVIAHVERVCAEHAAEPPAADGSVAARVVCLGLHTFIVGAPAYAAAHAAAVRHLAAHPAVWLTSVSRAARE